MIKKVGIIGIDGAYGKWLKSILISQKNIVVHGSDTSNSDYPPNESIILESDVIIFATPLEITAKLITSSKHLFNPSQLCLDIASIKKDIVKTLSLLPCETASLHPLTAPTLNSWKGQIVTITPVKLQNWSEWLKNLLHMTQAKVEIIEAEEHDRIMSFIQVLPHSLLISMASIFSEHDINRLPEFSTPTFRLMKYAFSRIFSMQPELFVDIQLMNRENAINVLKSILIEIQTILTFLETKDREKMIQHLEHIRKQLGDSFIEKNVERYNRILKFESDYTDGYSIRILCRSDYPGLLLTILSSFKKFSMNLLSLHSQRQNDTIIFYIGVEHIINPIELDLLKNELTKIGTIL
jgi:prephenate dehydrogenase